MPKVKVCHVTHGIVGSGVEQVIFNYCSRMTDKFQFDILYQYEPNPEILKKFQDAGFNCIQVPSKVSHPVKHLWTIYKLFKNNHYKIVHSHLDYFMNSYICLLAMLAGIKKRIAHHHQAYQNKNVMFSLLCAVLRLPCKLFGTDWLACGEVAAVNGWGRGAVKNGRVTILPNAIDPDQFKFSESARKEIRKRYGFKDDDFVIGHVGRFFPQKNHNFLIDVFFEVLKQKPNAKLLLLGDGTLQENIQRKVDLLGIGDSVIFAGIQKDTAPYYSAMDVFCFPSLYEGLGIVLLEAQFSGLPCYVSDVVPDEVCISQKFCKNPFDAFQWVKKITTTPVDVNARTSLLKNEKYDINCVFSKLLRIYEGN